jgi:hypothetical protein
MTENSQFIFNQNYQISEKQIFILKNKTEIEDKD